MSVGSEKTALQTGEATNQIIVDGADILERGATIHAIASNVPDGDLILTIRNGANKKLALLSGDPKVAPTTIGPGRTTLIYAREVKHDLTIALLA